MKKRSVSFVLAAVIILTMNLSVTASATELPIIPLYPVTLRPGDANGDGNINALDVLSIMRYMVGTHQEVFFERFADYNGDEKINARDVLTLMLDIVNGEV